MRKKLGKDGAGGGGIEEKLGKFKITKNKLGKSVDEEERRVQSGR